MLMSNGKTTVSAIGEKQIQKLRADGFIPFTEATKAKTNLKAKKRKDDKYEK